MISQFPIQLSTHWRSSASSHPFANLPACEAIKNTSFPKLKHTFKKKKLTHFTEPIIINS